MSNVNVSSPVLWQTTAVQCAASFSFEGSAFLPLLSPRVCLSLLHLYTASQTGRLHFWNCHMKSSGGWSHWEAISRVFQWLSLSLVSLGFCAAWWSAATVKVSYDERTLDGLKAGVSWQGFPSLEIHGTFMNLLPSSPPFLLHREVWFKGTLFRDILLEVSHSTHRATACSSLIETKRTLHTENYANKLQLCNAKYITNFLAPVAFSSCFSYNISGCFHSWDI